MFEVVKYSTNECIDVSKTRIQMVKDWNPVVGFRRSTEYQDQLCQAKDRLQRMLSCLTSTKSLFLMINKAQFVQLKQ